jgi:hypothetical protein
MPNPMNEAREDLLEALGTLAPGAAPTVVQNALDRIEDLVREIIRQHEDEQKE